jgi:hypothetical protein
LGGSGASDPTDEAIVVSCLAVGGESLELGATNLSW